MSALTAPRQIQRRNGRTFNYPVAAPAVCYAGALAVLALGALRPARAGQGGNDTAKANDAATYQAVGVFVESVTGGAGDGDVRVDVEAGVFNFVNSAGVDAIALADVGKPCFVVDDQTVARTSAGGTRPIAGVIEDVDADGVWVSIGDGERRVVRLPFAISEADTLAGTSAELISPVAGRISRLSVIVQKTVTTGGDVTALVGTTAVDGLACAIADGALKGAVVTDTPTAGHASTVVAAGDRIQVAPAAAFATAGAVSGFVEIAY
jgi:hypothetical protein